VIHDSRARAYTAWVIVCLVWGTTYLGIRIALETIPPFLMAAFRWIVAGGVIIVVFAARGERMPGPRAWGPLALLGILLLGLGNGGVVWAERTIPSGLTAVLVSLSPFWMVGIESMLHDGEALTFRRVAGLLVGFAGIVVLVWPDLKAGPGPGFLSGLAGTQIACVGWAIGSTWARRHGNRPDTHENVLVQAAFQMLFGGILLLLLGLVRGEWSALAFTARTFGALAYLTIFGAIAGFSAYAYALKHLPIAIVSLYAYVNPVIAVVLGTLVLQEPFGPRMAVAAGAVLAGVALVKDR